MMRRCSAGSRGQLESSGSQPPPIAEGPMTPASILHEDHDALARLLRRVQRSIGGPQALVSRVAVGRLSRHFR